MQRVLKSHSPICAFVAHRSLLLNTTRLWLHQDVSMLLNHHVHDDNIDSKSIEVSVTPIRM